MMMSCTEPMMAQMVMRKQKTLTVSSQMVMARPGRWILRYISIGNSTVAGQKPSAPIRLHGGGRGADKM